MFSIKSLNFKFFSFGLSCTLPWVKLVFAINFLIYNMYNVILTTWLQVHSSNSAPSPHKFIYFYSSHSPFFFFTFILNIFIHIHHLHHLLTQKFKIKNSISFFFFKNPIFIIFNLFSTNHQNNFFFTTNQIHRSLQKSYIHKQSIIPKNKLQFEYMLLFLHVKNGLYLYQTSGFWDFSNNGSLIFSISLTSSYATFYQYLENIQVRLKFFSGEGRTESPVPEIRIPLLWLNTVSRNKVVEFCYWVFVDRLMVVFLWLLWLV